jgi:hypothetical protein
VGSEKANGREPKIKANTYSLHLKPVKPHRELLEKITCNIDYFIKVEILVSIKKWPSLP